MDIILIQASASHPILTRPYTIEVSNKDTWAILCDFIQTLQLFPEFFFPATLLGTIYVKNAYALTSKNNF